MSFNGKFQAWTLETVIAIFQASFHNTCVKDPQLPLQASTLEEYPIYINNTITFKLVIDPKNHNFEQN